jgi:hypothetical protein
MDQILKFRKVTSLPATFEGSTMYMVPDATDPNLFEMHLSTSNGSSVKHLPNKADITNTINVAIGAAMTATGSIKVVANNTARNALAPTIVTMALVLDATLDPTVASGSATYVFDPAASTWSKIAEYESLDLQFNWAGLVGKPTSTVGDIDLAVTNSHTHANKAVLDGLSIAPGGSARLLSAGAPLRAYLESEAW